MQASLPNAKYFTLCDEATKEDAHLSMNFKMLPAVKLKGKASLIKMYRPKGMVHKREAARLIRDEGRTREIGELRERIASMRPVHAHTRASLTCIARAWHAQASCAR